MAFINEDNPENIRYLSIRDIMDFGMNINLPMEEISATVREALQTDAFVCMNKFRDLKNGASLERSVLLGLHEVTDDFKLDVERQIAKFGVDAAAVVIETEKFEDASAALEQVVVATETFPIIAEDKAPVAETSAAGSASLMGRIGGAAASMIFGQSKLAKAATPISVLDKILEDHAKNPVNFGSELTLNLKALRSVFMEVAPSFVGQGTMNTTQYERLFIRWLLRADISLNSLEFYIIKALANVVSSRARILNILSNYKTKAWYVKVFKFFNECTQASTRGAANKMPTIKIPQVFVTVSAAIWVLMNMGDLKKSNDDFIQKFVENQWFGQLNLDASMQSIHEAYERKFWTETVKSTKLENRPDTKFEFTQAFYDTKKADTYPLAYPGWVAKSAVITREVVVDYVNHVIKG